MVRYVLAEVALVIVGLTLLGVGVSSGASLFFGHLRARERAALMRHYPIHQPLSHPGDPAITAESGGIFLGMSDDLLLARLTKATITRAKVNKGGSSLSFRLDFADGSRAAFKPAQTNLQTIPRKEVAAYRICRLLGIVGVPPAIPRAVTRDELLSHLHPESVASLPRIRAETLFTPQGKTLGAASYWIPEIRDVGLDTPEGMRKAGAWMKVGAALDPADEALAAQFSNLIVFDFLTANPDRFSGGNIKGSPEGDRIYFMDNTMAFFLAPDGAPKTRLWLEQTERFSRALVAALPRLSESRLAHLLGPDVEGQEILTSSEIRAVVARREAVQHRVEGLIATHGEANVLVFP